LAGPFEPDDFGGEDGGDFAFDTDDIEKLQDKISKIVILHSKDDPVVPYEHALKYQAALPTATFVPFEDKSHFLVSEFPEIIQMIRDSV
jgi:pimeloyl-ACP methyl ester carboxylesterase